MPCRTGEDRSPHSGIPGEKKLSCFSSLQWKKNTPLLEKLVILFFAGLLPASEVQRRPAVPATQEARIGADEKTGNTILFYCHKKYWIFY